jgi:uncharacterized protein (DUF58 family)
MRGRLSTLELLDARAFQVLVRRLADSLSYGTDRSPFRGAGIEYVQSRPYAPGDPVRSIDWRITARTGRFHVKEYEAQKRMPVYLVLDTSASMTISSCARTKYEVAVHLSGGIALACLERVSPVGLVGAGERRLRHEPSLSKGRVMQWLLELKDYRFDEETRLAERLVELGPRLAQRSLILVLSDLHDDAALGALRQIAQRNDCAVLQLADPAEEGLRGAGILRTREAETGRERWTVGRKSPLRQAELERELRRAGIDHLRLLADQPYIPAVRQFLRARGVLGRVAR